ncbi:Aminotransferase-like [Theobroma cacao]|nr:Aminotransferase-like [Theobroma cacao]
MEKQSDTIFEAREELMVSPTGGYPTLRKAHFLKPAATSNNGNVSELPSDCFSPKPLTYDLKDLSEKMLFRGWKRPTEKWKRWVQNMHSKYQALWKQVGIYEAVMSSRYDMKQHKELVLGLAEKWCLDTNTFIFPWGEATITLEDVMVSGGYSVLGVSVLSPLKTKQLVEVKEKLIKGRKEAARARSLAASHKSWMDYFMGTGHDLEHEAFLSLWLSNFVLVNSVSFQRIGKHVFPIAIHLARGTRVALAPAVLSSIYRDLSLLKGWFFSSNVVQTNKLLHLYAPFQLVQLWVWERFPRLRPLPNSISLGEPRAARWHRLKMNAGDVKLAIDSAGTGFQWRPYAIADNNWSLPKFYGDKEQYILNDFHLDEEIQSFAMFLRESELVGLESIEQYLPHRVAMQFGMDQDLPGCIARCNENPEIAWRNYSRPIQDAVLYIPARLFESVITTQYSHWWKQSMLAQGDAIKAFVSRRRSPRKSPDASVRKNECYILFSPDHPLKCGEVSRGDSAMENEDRGVEVGGLVQEEDMEDQLTVTELLTHAKCDGEKTVMGGENESPLGTQRLLSSTKEIETLAKLEANMKSDQVSIQVSVKDQEDVILENIGEGDEIGCTLAVDVLSLSVRENQNVSTFIADKEYVKNIKSEGKQEAEVRRNESSIGESKGVVADDVNSKPSLNDGAEGSSTHDLATLAIELEARICRLEKLSAELKEKRLRKKLENQFKGISSEPQ